MQDEWPGVNLCLYWPNCLALPLLNCLYGPCAVSKRIVASCLNNERKKRLLSHANRNVFVKSGVTPTKGNSLPILLNIDQLNKNSFTIAMIFDYSGFKAFPLFSLLEREIYITIQLILLLEGVTPDLKKMNPQENS